MNRRSFMVRLAGTAVAAALAILPRVYGVPVSGWVGRPLGLQSRNLVCVFTVRSIGPDIKEGLIKIFNYKMDAAGNLSCWTRDDK